MLKFTCPHCGKVVQAKSTDAGKTARCPACRQTFKLSNGIEQPEVAEVVTPPAPATIPTQEVYAAETVATPPQQSPPAREKMSSTTVAVIVILTIPLVMVLSCGGCLFFAERAETRPAKTRPAPERVSVSLFTTKEVIYCATDEKFLDASPLTSPANFVKVVPGTKLARVGFGGLYSGKLHYVLQGGNSQRIYVYKSTFETSFVSANGEPSQ